MYSDTITLFNKHESRSGDMWYPTVIHNVNLLIDKAVIVDKYGPESKDRAVLNIKCQTVGGQIFVDGKPYLSPKEWEKQTDDKLAESITFANGTNFDFFMLGEYGSTEPIADDDYLDGFYNHINSKYDYVFSINSIAQYTAIPHFEIVGA